MQADTQTRKAEIQANMQTRTAEIQALMTQQTNERNQVGVRRAVQRKHTAKLCQMHVLNGALDALRGAQATCTAEGPAVVSASCSVACAHSPAGPSPASVR